jgi:hypothetical protein
MATSPTELGPEHDYAGERQQQLEMTDQSSRQRERLTTNPQLSNSNKNLVVSPRWVLYSKTDGALSPGGKAVGA